MTKVTFNKNAGRFKKGQVVDFPPALADFFVSKVRCADPEQAATKEDFSDVLGPQEPKVPVTAPPANKTSAKPKPYQKHKYGRRDMIDYSKQDLRVSK